MKVRLNEFFGMAVGICLMISGMPVNAQRAKLILDADTANEIDDMYAIVRILSQDKFDVLGISSAQWFHYLGNPESVQASQAVNEDLVRLLNRTDLPLPLGAERPMGKPWGGNEPKDSEASRFIIQQARGIPDGEFLYVVSIGATTNLASALKRAPEIAPRIKAYLMGFRYDGAKQVWNKSEFNIRRDLNAADFLLNQADLELHIMTATLSEALKFDQADTFARHKKMGRLGEYLTEKWNARFADSKRWVMWDLALVEAMLRPDLVSEKEVSAPPENGARKIWVYDRIDVDGMRADYWQAAKEVAASH